VRRCRGRPRLFVRDAVLLRDARSRRLEDRRPRRRLRRGNARAGPAGARLYAVAADRDQGRLLLDSIDGFHARTPELRGALEVGAFRVAAPRRKAVLELLAADGPSAWGLRPYLAVADELAQWPATPSARSVWEAVATAAAKLAGARLVVLTTAGDPAHWSYKVLEHARSDPLWRTSEIEGPPPWLSPERLEEQRRRLLPSAFARLFENRWTASEDRLVDPDDLRACVVLDGHLPPARGRRYVIGLDVGIRHERTAATVCHAERIVEGGEARGVRVVLDRLQVWAGRGRAHEVQLDEVAEWIAWASSSYNRAEVVFDPSQAILLAQQLRRRRVRMEEFTFHPRSISQLALDLHGLIRSRSLLLPDDPDLLDELEHVRLRETSPGTYRIDHDPDRHDDIAIALGLAAQRLVSTSEFGPLRASSPARSRIGIAEHFGWGGRPKQAEAAPLKSETGPAAPVARVGSTLSVLRRGGPEMEQQNHADYHFHRREWGRRVEAVLPLTRSERAR
jgi:hypothetical protein